MGNGFSLFGGSNQDNFIDMTNPNRRSRNNPNQLRKTASFMHSKARQPARDEEILASIEATSASPMRKAVLKGQINAQKEEYLMSQQDILDSATGGMLAEDLAAARIRKAKIEAGARRFAGDVRVGATRVIGQTAEAAGTGMRQGRASFSAEQNMIGEMFGQGEHIWGVNNNPVTINNDLNSSRSDPFDETAGMFGFGRNGERSGLF